MRRPGCARDAQLPLTERTGEAKMIGDLWKGIRAFFEPEGHEGLETPQNEVATFVLRYGDLEVGILRLENGMWEFRYAEQFVGRTLSAL